MRYHVTPWVLGAVLVLGTGGAVEAADYEDLFSKAFQSCVSGCHNADQTGALQVSGSTASAWCNAVVNKGGNKSNSGKLYVLPGHPEMSFVVDKMRGHVKAGEGDPMIRGGRGEVYFGPGIVEAVEAWIREGASCPGGDDFMVGPIPTGHPQPAFSPAAVPTGAVRIQGDSFDVGSSAFDQVLTTEGGNETTVQAANAAGHVTRIQVHASAATEYVALYRGDDAAPLAVARGESLDLQLPDGVGIPVDASQEFRIVQRIRNEYWLSPGHPDNPDSAAGFYYNQTTGRVAIDLHVTTAGVDAEATPFIDTTGTDLLAVPAQRIGATGGAWPGSPPATVSGAAVGLWTGRYAITAGLVDAANGTAEFDPAGEVTANLPANEELREGYTVLSEPGAPVAPLGYACVHNNGATHVMEHDLAFATTLANAEFSEFIRPIKTACEVDDPTVGLPRLLAEAPKNCARSHQPYDPPPFSFGNDCEGIGTERCAPATLVGGPGVDDGRCTLVGLWW